MTVGTINFPPMFPIEGIRLGTACAGIKQNNRDDLVIIEMVENAACAGVFTRNIFCAAPVQLAKKNIGQGSRWLLINSGNANAGNGKQGLLDSEATLQALSKLVNCETHQILPFSTGVIGETFPVNKINAALPIAIDHLSTANWKQAATAIMTTDTVPKGVSKQIRLGQSEITITGIAKGSGMIHPDMATLLSFVATDAKVEPKTLQNCLHQAVEKSLNAISVDGDTSTNDACILMASGAVEGDTITQNHPDFPAFCNAITDVLKSLAKLIIRDGEGATKLIRINIAEANSLDDAKHLAKTIAHSPLVKTAFFASDPNWGRILAAVGRSGIANLSLDRIEIFLNEVCIVRHGGRDPNYTEQAGINAMSQQDISITIKLGMGQVSYQFLSCDFSYDYVKINADYRT